MFGKILASVVEGVADAVELTTSVGLDVVKSPVRFVEMLEGDEVDFLDDTRQTIEEIKSR